MLFLLSYEGMLVLGEGFEPSWNFPPALNRLRLPFAPPQHKAAGEGLEPPSAGPGPAVLPLDDPAKPPAGLEPAPSGSEARRSSN